MNTHLLSAETRERDKIARLSRSLYERGLPAGSSGNISEAARLSGLQRASLSRLAKKYGVTARALGT